MNWQSPDLPGWRKVLYNYDPQASVCMGSSLGFLPIHEYSLRKSEVGLFTGIAYDCEILDNEDKHTCASPPPPINSQCPHHAQCEQNGKEGKKKARPSAPPPPSPLENPSYATVAWQR